MSASTLVRRKVQLEALQQACAARRRVRVTPAGACEARGTVHTRLYELTTTDVLLEWPTALVAPTGEGVIVDVYFPHEDELLAFRTRSLGRLRCDSHMLATVLWRLDLPVCIENRQQRRQVRVSLDEVEPLMVRFINQRDETSFAAQLTNLSASGLGALAPADALPHARTGELYWTRFTLPGEPAPVELVVRLVHNRPLLPQQAAQLGCVFCAGEDPAAHNDRIGRIADFVAQRAQLLTSSNPAVRAGGQ